MCRACEESPSLEVHFRRTEGRGPKEYETHQNEQIAHKTERSY